MSDSCTQGWKDGSCCCNCVNFLPLSKHPWNTGEGHGPISETMGHVCVIDIDGQRKATFYQHNHGMCEFHFPTFERSKRINIERAAKKFGV